MTRNKKYNFEFVSFYINFKNRYSYSYRMKSQKKNKLQISKLKI